jgi:AhpD family alkylhydroperoxidase
LRSAAFSRADSAGPAGCGYWNHHEKENRMAAIESIAPGFSLALENAPVTLATHRKLSKALEETPLSARNRAQIALAIAQQLRCEYCIWVQTCVAEAAGLNGEDICLARAGTALDLHESSLVKLACRAVSGGVFRNRVDRSFMGSVGEIEAAAVITEVALAIVNCYVLQSVAPARCDAVGSRRVG